MRHPEFPRTANVTNEGEEEDVNIEGEEEDFDIEGALGPSVMEAEKATEGEMGVVKPKRFKSGARKKIDNRKYKMKKKAEKREASKNPGEKPPQKIKK